MVKGGQLAGQTDDDDDDDDAVRKVWIGTEQKLLPYLEVISTKKFRQRVSWRIHHDVFIHMHQQARLAANLFPFILRVAIVSYQKSPWKAFSMQINGP